MTRARGVVRYVDRGLPCPATVFTTRMTGGTSPR